MRFRIKWLQEALDDLTRIWMDADSELRRAITVASGVLDEELQADPYRESESREGDDRVMFVFPLGVLFEIDLQQGIVWVIHVWFFHKRDHN